MVERQSRVFGKRKEPHTIIIARGDDIRHFQVRPWIAALAGSALAAIAIGYLAATSYLVLRDDLIGASVSRQARMQQAYEDRISALRAQVDRITSRQLLDQQLMEGKVAELLDRQTRLSSRDSRLGKVLGLTPGELGEVPLPTPKPDQHADAGADMFVTASIGPAIDSGLLGTLFGKDPQQSGNETAADRADRDVFAFEHLEHADVGDAAGTAAAQHQTDAARFGQCRRGRHRGRGHPEQSGDRHGQRRPLARVSPCATQLCPHRVAPVPPWSSLYRPAHVETRAGHASTCICKRHHAVSHDCV